MREQHRAGISLDWPVRCMQAESVPSEDAKQASFGADIPGTLRVGPDFLCSSGDDLRLFR